MNAQKTYLKKSAGQWLAQAEICESKSGQKEIFIKKGIIARHHPGGMMLEDYDGPIAILALDHLQNEKFCEMMELRDDAGA